VLQNYQSRGIHVLRDGGDAWNVSVAARNLAPAYDIRYLSPVFPIHKHGHYGKFIGVGYDSWMDYLKLLDEVEKQNGDFVKLMISGLIDFSKENSLTEESVEPEEIIKLIEEAHRRGLAVMAHANGDVAVQAALEAKVDTIEHGAYLGKDTLQKMACSNTVWVPTLSTIGNMIGNGRFPNEVLTQLLKSQQKKIFWLVQNGGHVGLGSDAGAYCVKHEHAAEDELGYLTQAIGEQTAVILSSAEKMICNAFYR